jgi:site-specific recombinase XerD
VGNIESSRGIIRVIGKNNQEREVALTETLLTDLRQYWKDYRPVKPWLFTGKQGKPVSIEQAQRAFRKAVRHLGFKKTVTPHTLRHTYATLLLQEKTDLRVIQCLLGHKHLASTEKYAHVNATLIRNSPDVLKMLTS